MVPLCDVRYSDPAYGTAMRCPVLSGRTVLPLAVPCPVLSGRTKRAYCATPCYGMSSTKRSYFCYAMCGTERRYGATSHAMPRGMCARVHAPIVGHGHYSRLPYKEPARSCHGMLSFSLRACYAMSGTAIARGAVCLCARYTESGTELA
eukprot:705700-Rhodomonas_salina.2